MSTSDKSFASDAKKRFDESVDSLDAASLSTLNQARHRALGELHDGRVRWLRWAPAAGMAAAVMLVALLVIPDTVELETSGSSAVDLEILLGEESIEMLEDLEFYALIDLLEEDGDAG